MDTLIANRFNGGAISDTLVVSNEFKGAKTCTALTREAREMDGTKTSKVDAKHACLPGDVCLHFCAEIPQDDDANRASGDPTTSVRSPYP